ncbi:MAG: hypothetical protein HOJ88_01680, partial [Proteobacteria bacterium]|nr:hypothetical protein [Pseudomonadota bacterium]
MKQLIIGLAVGAVATYFYFGTQATNEVVEVEAVEFEETTTDVVPATSYAAVPGQVGGQDFFGAYDVVAGWPINIADQIEGHEDWT